MAQKKDTTQQGVSSENNPGTAANAETETPKVEPTRYLPHREAFFDTIAKRRAQLKNEVAPEDRDSIAEPDPEVARAKIEAQDEPEEGGEPEPSTTAEQAAPEHGDAPDADAGADGAAPAEPPEDGDATQQQPEVLDASADVKVRIKVNGRIVEAPLSQLARSYSMEAAGQELLRQAAAKEKQLQALQAQLEQQAAALAQGRVNAAGDADAAPAQNDPPATDEAILEDIGAKLQYGEPDQVKTAIKKLIDLVSAQTGRANLRPDEIAARVKAELDRQNALETIAREYPAIFEDADYTELAAKRVLQIRQGERQSGSTPRSDLEVFRQACSDVVKKFKLPSSPIRPAAGSSGNSSRVDAKRRMPQPPAAASVRAPAPPAEPPRKTRSQIIAEMRRARGQPV